MTACFPEGHLPLQKPADRYNLTYHQLYKLTQRCSVRCTRTPSDAVLVDVASREDWLLPKGWA